MIGLLTLFLKECLFFLGYVAGGQQYPKALTLAEEKQLLSELAQGSENARRELILRYYAEVRPEEHPEWLTDDAPMWIWFAACSRIRASEEVTAVHRMLPESVSQSRAYRARIAFCDSLCDISLWFDARYGAGRHLRALRRRRMRVALWVLSRDGTTAEYLSRWWRDVRRTPLLVFDAAGYGLLVKKWLRRQPKR